MSKKYRLKMWPITVMKQLSLELGKYLCYIQILELTPINIKSFETSH